MCAQYGLGGGAPGKEYDFEPFDLKREDERSLREWAKGYGKANITRIKKDGTVNLNPIVRADRHGGREVVEAWWWLWVAGAPSKYTAFNARDDKLVKSPMWHRPFRSHRALLPATWYIEKGARFELPDAGLFGIAAIYAYDPENELLSYSLVTRPAIAASATVHDRMPLILPSETYAEWLDPERDGDQELIDQAIEASDGVVQELVKA